MEELKYTIAEASERLGDLSYRTLHYYEQKLGLNISRDGSGNRVYSEYDIEMFEKIIELKKKGMTLDGIKALFQEKGILNPEENNHVVVVDEKALEIKEYLISEIRLAVAQQMKEELEETNAKMDQLIAENQELREEIQKIGRQSEEHYSKIDQQLMAWREKNKEKESEQQPWYKKLFNNNKT